VGLSPELSRRFAQLADKCVLFALVHHALGREEASSGAIKAPHAARQQAAVHRRLAWLHEHDYDDADAEGSSDRGRT
jgi:hypothetical protein